MKTDKKDSVDHIEHHGLLFDVRRSVRYHNRRRLFFDRISKWSDASTAVFGSATIVSLVAESSIFPKQTPMLLAAATAILSAVNLVFDTKAHARLHHDLARKFIEIEKVLINPKLNTEQFTKAKADRLDIEAEEPPVMRVLDLLCHNELARAMGYNEDHSYKIRFWRAMFANLFDVLPGSITKVRDSEPTSLVLKQAQK